MSTDYHKPIANAVGRLRPNTLAARRSIYDQARQLLFEEAQNSQPPMPVSELIAEQRALEDAIQMVEAEAVFNENADAVREDDYFRGPPPARSQRPVQPPQPPVERTRAPVRRPPAQPAAPQEKYQEQYQDEYYEEPQYEPAQKNQYDDPRANRLREQEQRRLDAEQRRAQRQPRARAPRAPRQGGSSRNVVIVAVALLSLFLVGGAAAYVTIYGMPSWRSLLRATPQQAPQQKQAKQNTAAPQVDPNVAKFRDLLDRASKALEGGDPSQSIQLLTEAIVVSPKEASAYTLRGHSYLQTGDSAKAIEDFSEAIKLGSKDFYAFVGRAVAYRRIRDFTRSIADYNEALKIRPDHAGAWNNRCFVQAIAGNLDAALADCNESLRLVQNEPNTLDSRALVYLKKGSWDLAITDYDTVLKIAPNTVSALYGRGLAKLKKGDKRGQADIATATAAAPTIAQEFERYGVK